MDGSSRTQVPLAAGEAMGLTLSAEGDIVTLSRDGQTMSLQVGQAVGGTTVVELSSSITAGPCISMPGRRSSRR